VAFLCKHLMLGSHSIRKPNLHHVIWSSQCSGHLREQTRAHRSSMLRMPVGLRCQHDSVRPLGDIIRREHANR